MEMAFGNQMIARATSRLDRQARERDDPDAPTLPLYGNMCGRDPPVARAAGRSWLDRSRIEYGYTAMVGR